MTNMVPTVINGRWGLLLPEHRAVRPSWPWWEATRLAAEHHVISNQTDAVVWVAGAEEGDFPALYASWGAKVFMAEPNPRVWPNIKAIFDWNHLADDVIGCWPGFIGDQNAGPEATITGPAPYWPVSAYGEVIGDHGFCQLGERPDLPAVTLDTLVAKGFDPPTVVTMDVEGSELHVLRGAHETIREHRPHVFVSIHQAFAHAHYGIEDVTYEIATLLDSLGYSWDDHHTYLCTDHEAHHWWHP